jgi:hypothetical protein
MDGFGSLNIGVLPDTISGMRSHEAKRIKAMVLKNIIDNSSTFSNQV